MNAAFKEARQHQGLSQEKVAQRARCSTATVRNVERGIAPSPRMQGRLARVLGLEPGELWPQSDEVEEGSA